MTFDTSLSFVFWMVDDVFMMKFTIEVAKTLLRSYSFWSARCFF